MRSRDPVARAARCMRLHVDEFALEILGVCRREILAYGTKAGDEALEIELLQTFAREAGVLLDTLIARRQFGEQELAAIEDIARRRLVQGFSADDVIRGYNIGIRLGLGQLLNELHQLRPAPDNLNEIICRLIDEVMASAGVAADAIARAFREAKREADHPDGPSERAALTDLLTRDFSDAAARTRLQHLRVAPAPYFVCAVIDDGAALPRQRGRELEEALHAALGAAANSILTGPSGADLVVIVGLAEGRRPPPLLSALAAWATKLGAAIGLGLAEPAPSGIRRSARQARASLDVRQAFANLPKVLPYEQALPYALLRAAPEITAEIERVSVAPILAHDADPATIPLLPALRAYLHAAGNTRVAAEALHVHRRTFLRRLDAIESAVMAPIREPGDMLLLALGMFAADRIQLNEETEK